MLTLIPIVDTQMKVAFNESESPPDKGQIQQICQSKAGNSVRVDNYGMDVEVPKAKAFVVVISCVDTHMRRLMRSAPRLGMRYPSFIKATDAAYDVSLKSLEPPRGKKLIKLRFEDTFSNWQDDELDQLIEDIAQMTHVNEDTIDVVEISGGSVIIVLRLPEAAAQTLIKNSSERKMLKAKFRTLETIELIADLTPRSEIVSVAHAVSTDSGCMLY